MHRNPTPSPLLLQNILELDMRKPGHLYYVPQLREDIMRRLTGIPNWPYNDVDAANLTNLFLTASGFKRLDWRDMDHFHEYQQYRYPLIDPLFFVHPRLRAITVTRSRVTLIKNLPVMLNEWPSADDLRVLYTNAFLAACGYRLLSAREEDDVKVQHLYATISPSVSTNDTSSPSSHVNLSNYCCHRCFRF